MMQFQSYLRAKQKMSKRKTTKETPLPNPNTKKVLKN